MTRKPNLAPRALLLIAAFALSGCSGLLGPSNPPAQIYMLEPAFTAPPDAPASSAQLAIGSPDVANVLDTLRIALNRGQIMDYYADAQWTDNTPRLLQSLFVEAFEKSGKIGSVERDSDGMHADYILETELRDFEAHYDGDSGAPTIVVNIVAKLVTSDRRNVVATFDTNKTALASQNSVPAVVAAFNQATGAALEDVVGWTLRKTASPEQAQPGATPALPPHRRHRRPR
jgi:cholesterol transport system auxiliary component